MKSLFEYIKECGELYATPDNTTGMGNPMPADVGIEGTEPLVQGKPLKPLKKKKRKVKESLLDDEESLDDNSKQTIINSIKDYIGKNYIKCDYKISDEPDENGKFVVNSLKSVTANRFIKELTNDHFVWGKVAGSFDCSFCVVLTSLKGAPKEVGNIFDCSYCRKLTSLEGAPKIVLGGFDCGYCISLTSIKHCPEEVRGQVNFSNCKNLKDLDAKYLPKNANILFIDGTKFAKSNDNDKKLKDWAEKTKCFIVNNNVY